MMFQNRLVYFAGGSTGPEAQKAPETKAEAPAVEKIDYSKEIEKYVENKKELSRLKKQVDYIVAQPEIQKSTHINVLKAIQAELDAYLKGEMPEVNKSLIERFLEMSNTVIPYEMVLSSIDASYLESSQGDSSQAVPGVEEAPGEPTTQQKEAPKTRLEDQEAKWTSERMESEINYLVDFYTQKGEQGKVDELMSIMTKIDADKLAGKPVEKYQAEVVKLRPATPEYAANFEKFYQEYLAYLAKNPKEAGGSAYAVPGIDVETPTGEQKEAPQGKLTDEELKWSRERLESEVTYLTDYYIQSKQQDKVDTLTTLGTSIAEARQSGKGVDQYLAEVAKLRPAVPEYTANFEKYYQEYLAYLAKNPKTAGGSAYAVPGIDSPSAAK